MGSHHVTPDKSLVAVSGLLLAVAISLSFVVLSAKGHNPGQIPLYLSLCASFFAVEVVPLPMPRGASFRLAGGVAVAALLIVDPWIAGTAYLLGGSSAILFERSRRMRNHLANLLRRIATLVAVGLAYRLAVHGQPIDARQVSSMAPALFAAVSFVVLDVAGWVGVSERGGLAARRRSALTLLRLFGGVYLGQVSVGIVLAVVYPSLGLLAFAVLVVLMLIMQHTFGLLLRVRTAYTRTVSALSLVAEMSDGGKVRHGERVASTAAAIGRHLGFNSLRIERLTLASLVHDIGLISMDETDEGRKNKRTVAEVGAKLVSQVSFLAGLAPVVRRHYVPYADYIDTQEADGLLSRVIHVACDLDDLSAGVAPPRAARDSVSPLIERGRGTEYDPIVLDALQSAIRAGEV